MGGRGQAQSARCAFRGQSKTRHVPGCCNALRWRAAGFQEAMSLPKGVGDAFLR